jgi:hypothetical protein
MQLEELAVPLSMCVPGGHVMQCEAPASGVYIYIEFAQGVHEDEAETLLYVPRVQSLQLEELERALMFIA